ncbi:MULTISPECIES: phospholipase D family protein [Rhodococcus]|uniref:phospholipase D family protein n=1 Tax=Rhodococcus TaxID=1827 RepID=UPI0007DB29AC|nr:MULTISPECIES: phospholipase D family protein [Rhodococcus]AZI66027.1 phosphatidylserine/phosphatidylglycerophosphate/cardiolipin synthase family protein [Rhodococcus sp. NJ-530]
MGTSFHGPNPWPHITRAIRTRGPRYAAVPYLGHLAPELLPLRSGDLLVVNASTAAIRAHATSPVVLSHYLSKGVRILSSSALHAKVIVTNQRAVIGSANASENSIFSHEAVIISDDPQVVADSRAFINNIDETTTVDQTFIDNAEREWATGRAVPIPGIAGRIQNLDNDFLPTPTNRVFIRRHESHPHTRTPPVKKPSMKELSVDPTARYRLETLTIEKPCSIARGDVVIRVSMDDELLLPPAAVISNQERMPLSPSQFHCFLRVRNDLVPLPAADVEKRLADVGHPSAQLRSNHYVRSPSLRAELLALWSH